MPPTTFRQNTANSPRQPTPKRRLATFRDGQSPLPVKRRKFGTDLTNNAGIARPVFKPEARPAEQPKRPLELLKNSKEHKTPVKFASARRDDTEDVDLGSSPLAKPNASETPLATLIEARILETQTQEPHTDRISLDPMSLERWNDVCAMTADTIIINPRRLPLELANIHRYSSNSYVAGMW